jgi:hypothetical protein
MDDQLWMAYFDADNISKRGYEFEKGTILRVSLPHDARQVDNILHPMNRLLKSMRNNMGVAPRLELRGRPDMVQSAINSFEYDLKKAGFKVIEMPKGFVVGWG